MHLFGGPENCVRERPSGQRELRELVKSQVSFTSPLAMSQPAHHDPDSRNLPRSKLRRDTGHVWLHARVLSRSNSPPVTFPPPRNCSIKAV